MWSKRNREHIERLIKEKRMQPAGMKEVDAAKQDGRWDQAYDKPSDVLKELQLKEDIDFAKAGKYAVIMGTRMSGLTKSGIHKLIGTKIYKEMTMRNYNTTSKLLALMEKK